MGGQGGRVPHLTEKKIPKIRKILGKRGGGIEGFHVTSLQQDLPSHVAHSGHVGSYKIWPNSLLLKLHKA